MHIINNDEFSIHYISNRYMNIRKIVIDIITYHLERSDESKKIDCWSIIRHTLLDKESHKKKKSIGNADQNSVRHCSSRILTRSKTIVASKRKS